LVELRAFLFEIMGAKRVSRNEINQMIELYYAGNTFRDIGKALSRTHACVTENLILVGAYRKGEMPLNAEARKNKHQSNAVTMGSKNKSEHRKHYENCIKCLSKIGFGKRIIAKILKVDCSLASNVMKANNCKVDAKRFIEWRRETYKSKQKRINQRVARACKTRLRDSMRLIGEKKDCSARKLIGCTIDEFRSHIEKQFTAKMTWENYGAKWHLDHIVPCAKFDLTKEHQQKICFHFTNYRPLCAKINMREKDRKNINQQLPLPI
jgi:hypothetical protein